MKRLIILLSLTMLSFTVKGKEPTVISGTVKNSAGNQLSSAMVRATLSGGERPFIMTDVNGAYTLKIESEEDSFEISFSKLGYEQEKVTVENKSQLLDITLSKSATALPEVYVKSPEVRLRSDTISFLLSAFAGKGDVSLKDALKKVPGVEVSSSGEISYNGKSISNFYVEGMDLLGGKYDIATSNIPASYVDAVEILNNHKDRKIDRDIFSDNVAMNVRLKPKAKFRPTGTYGVSAGIGDPLPLAASGAGMMFRNKFQSILTFKGSDINEFSERENVRFSGFGRSNSRNYASDILGRLSAFNPPISRSRWIKPIDASATINLINKISDDVTLRTDAGYSFRKTDYNYSDTRLYFDGKNDIVIEQQTRPESWSHTPSLSVEYKVNKDNFYFINYFDGKGSFAKDALSVASFGKEIRERENIQNFNLFDMLDWSWKSGKIRWGLSSHVELNYSPKGYIGISEHDSSKEEDNDNRNLLQQARSLTFMVKENLSAMWEIRRSRISLPFDLNYTFSKINTALSYNPIYDDNTTGDGNRVANNRANGNALDLSLSPHYNYTASYDRLVFTATLPITLKYNEWDNSGTSLMKDSGFHVLLAPSIYMNYQMTAKSTIRMQASYYNNVGDILDLLSAPIMRDYLSLSYRSGQLSVTKSFNASLRYDFKLPLNFWFINADFTYNNSHSNLISRQDVSEGLIEVSDFLLPHSNDSFGGNLGISKSFKAINTKISARAGYSISHNKIEQNGQLIPYRRESVFVSPKLNSRPIGWLELDYNGNFSISSSEYLGRKRSFGSQNHDICASFFPLNGFQIKLTTEISHKEIEVHRYQTLTLVDIKLAYKFKKFRLTYELNNIFNRKSYSYTIFSALDRFTYNYSLRGRELILSFEYHL